MITLELVKLIQEDINKKNGKYIANDYYYHKNRDITYKRTIDIVDTEGNLRTIELDVQCNLYTNFISLLVDQKISYMLSRELTLDKNDIVTETQLEDIIEEALLTSSLEKTAWVFIYDTENVDFILVPDKEILPIYDKYKKRIEQIIRYYKEGDEIKVEQWFKDKVIYSTIKDDKITNQNVSSQYKIQEYEDGQLINEEQINYGIIPFIPLYNNKAKLSDLDPIKELIDWYNEISSGFLTNIVKFQEAIVKIIGFSGDKDTLKETMENLKKYKIAGVPEGGNIDYLSIDIPVEARKVLLEILESAIFKVGKGVDTNKTGDGNITNVVIKSRYAGLDMKTNGTIKQAKRFYEELIEKINVIKSSNIKKDITFNRAIVINETEQIGNVKLSLDMGLSEETCYNNHPWVKSYKEEKKRKDKENKDEVTKLKEEIEKLKSNNIGGNNDDNGGVLQNNKTGNESNGEQT